ncbi:hypothetical protein [Dactylosporangium sp. NPDC000521]|uniref:hypothetical protein n=1 Tax=Dactylosporangium sp. NPDC000521 TaxID=3363975 RepID=UPI0036884E32
MNTDYFVADRRRAVALAEYGPAGTEVPMLLMKWVEPTVLGSKLWAIIDELPGSASSDGLSFDLDRRNAVQDVVLMNNIEGTSGIVQIADGFVQVLKTLAVERVPAVAQRWSTAEEWFGPWEQNELDDTVHGLCDLARRVQGRDDHMYMWWSM